MDKANSLVNKIKELASTTQKRGAYNNIGSFGAVFEIPERFKAPLLVSGTDGVGTKLKLAVQFNQHTTIGIDLVAMCVNDIICHGAEPLFFLDYYATGSLDTAQAYDILSGIVAGCQQAGAALVGGETAEMPGLYEGSDYDLAGFAVGAVEKSRLIERSHVQAGNVLIALASSGAHANGFSLIQKILRDEQVDCETTRLGDNSLKDILLAPTKIYVPAVLSVLESLSLQGIAHITGGGLLENLPRVLAPHTQAIIDSHSWEWPVLFSWLQETGNIPLEEMYRTFNVGVGMVLIIKEEHVHTALSLLTTAGEEAWVIGRVQESSQPEPHVVIA
eukprot:TRINITY_DN17228_c0_g1_i1.p1 TRINITY_DN17228_c0_g1~~TRINITY_DN17228_c0_g1_i1.p1  ORF type:complete len:385 (+),score=-45.69 TRINITY_DN17228_c0_g1_i1:162-1157(+)